MVLGLHTICFSFMDSNLFVHLFDVFSWTGILEYNSKPCFGPLAGIINASSPRASPDDDVSTCKRPGKEEHQYRNDAYYIPMRRFQVRGRIPFFDRNGAESRRHESSQAELEAVPSPQGALALSVNDVRYRSKQAESRSRTASAMRYN